MSNPNEMDIGGFIDDGEIGSEVRDVYPGADPAAMIIQPPADPAGAYIPPPVGGVEPPPVVNINDPLRTSAFGAAYAGVPDPGQTTPPVTDPQAPGVQPPSPPGSPYGVPPGVAPPVVTPPFVPPPGTPAPGGVAAPGTPAPGGTPPQVDISHLVDPATGQIDPAKVSEFVLNTRNAYNDLAANRPSAPIPGAQAPQATPQAGGQPAGGLPPIEDDPQYNDLLTATMLPEDYTGPLVEEDLEKIAKITMLATQISTRRELTSMGSRMEAQESQMRQTRVQNIERQIGDDYVAQLGFLKASHPELNALAPMVTNYLDSNPQVQARINAIKAGRAPKFTPDEITQWVMYARDIVRNEINGVNPALPAGQQNYAAAHVTNVAGRQPNLNGANPPPPYNPNPGAYRGGY